MEKNCEKKRNCTFDGSIYRSIQATIYNNSTMYDCGGSVRDADTYIYGKNH